MDANEVEPPTTRRAERRRRREYREARRRQEGQRDALLRAQLGPGEGVLANRLGIMVTDHRILFVWRLVLTQEESIWTFDSLGYQEVTRWFIGRRHDDRPLLRLDHATHVRRERVVAHNILSFHWGNTVADVPHDSVTLAFSNDRDGVFRAICGCLQNESVPRGADFKVALPDDRQAKTQGRIVYLRR